MGLVAKAFQDIITFSRASSGTYVNSNGYITNSSVLNYLTYSNQPENAAWTKSNSFVQQNVLLYSEDFTNANWSTVNVAAPTANTTIAPDGTLTADTITCSAGLNSHNINQITSLTGTPVTFSVYLKSGTHSFVQIFHGALATNYANFNISTGVVGTVGAGFTSASMTSVGNGWFRCVVTLTPTANSAFRIAFISSSTAVYNESWTAAGTETFFAWGAQFVQGSVPGDYRATTSAALPCLYADYNGALRARKLCESAINALHINLQIPTVNASTVYTLSEILKAGERTKAALLDGAGSGAIVIFDLQAGTVVSQTNATGTITSAGNGYYRCSATMTTGVAQTSLNWRIATVDAANNTTYTGDGSSGIYIADAQLNDGSSALAYYDTTQYAYNAPRFDYDPVTLAAKGLLVEESRANLLLQSNDFQTSWTPTNITRTLNSTLSPSGNVDGVKIAATAAAGTNLVQAATVAATSATFSVYVKQGTGPTTANVFLLRNNTSATNLVGGTLNYSTGVFTYTTGSTGVVILNAGNGWWRVQISSTTGITSGDAMGCYVGFTGGVPAAGDFLYAYGAQLEAGAFATSVILTTTSQVTRAADVASVNTLSPWYNSVAGTFYAEYDTTVLRVGSTTVYNVVSADAGNSNNQIALYNYSNFAGGRVVTGGSTQADINGGGSPTNDVTIKSGIAYAVNNVAVTANGAAPGTDASVTLPTVDRISLGQVASTGLLNGHLRRITYYPRRLTNAELQTLTTL